MKRLWGVVVVLAVLLIAAPVVTAGVQFLKVARTGSGNVNATLPAAEQSVLSGVILSLANTGTIPGGAYWRVRLHAVDGGAYDPELYRKTDAAGTGEWWSPEQPIPMKKGGAVIVTYPNSGSITSGTWSVQGFFSTQ